MVSVAETSISGSAIGAHDSGKSMIFIDKAHFIIMNYNIIDMTNLLISKLNVT